MNITEIQEKEIAALLKGSGLKLSEFNNVDTLTDSFIDYANNIDSKKIDLGFPELDKQIRGLRTQELLTVTAPTGIGKSALALNFLMNFVRTNNECIGSPENGISLF